MADPDLAEHVRLLLDFANSLDVELGTESLDSAAAVTRWLAGRELLASGPRATGADLVIALELRAAVRQAMHDHEQARVRALPEVDAVAARLPLRITYAEGRPRSSPARDGVRGALTAIVAAITEAHADGSWRRLKLCDAEDCRWAFYDTSKNRSRQWCSMGVCGNRSKTRAWRARRRAVPGAG